MKRIVIVLVFLAAALAGTAPRAAADEITAEEVVARFVVAVGGREAIERIETRVCLGRVINDLSWKDPTREVTPLGAWSTADGRLLVAELGRDGIRREWTDGDSVWVQEGTKIERAEEIRRKFAWFYNPRGALRLNEYFPGLRFRGIEQREGRDVYALEPGGDLDPLYYTLFFDVATGLLTELGHYWVVGDWREVDGILVPHRIACDRKGGSSTFVYDHVFHNHPLDGARFAPPTIAGF